MDNFILFYVFWGTEFHFPYVRLSTRKENIGEVILQILFYITLWGYKCRPKTKTKTSTVSSKKTRQFNVNTWKKFICFLSPNNPCAGMWLCCCQLGIPSSNSCANFKFYNRHGWHVVKTKQKMHKWKMTAAGWHSSYRRSIDHNICG